MPAAAAGSEGAAGLDVSAVPPFAAGAPLLQIALP